MPHSPPYAIGSVIGVYAVHWATPFTHSFRTIFAQPMPMSRVKCTTKVALDIGISWAALRGYYIHSLREQPNEPQH